MPAEVRRLVAVLFADIAGYTAMMQADEAKALSCLQKFKDELNTQVAAYQGEVIQFYGDGCLAVFNSSIDALACAKSMQESFLQEPQVPVRIGLHVGDILFKEGNIFGDAVNIASRVESIGVPGSVLFSSDVHQQVKNQPAFRMMELGQFQFKNVEGAVTVYALTHEGFLVPEQDKIAGKVVDKPTASSKYKKWLIPALAILGILIVITLWKMNPFESALSSSSTLSEEVRQKRLAVLVFENQTMDASLDAFGKMISDWITQGLMETGEADVISAANIQLPVDQAAIGAGPQPEVAAATGVDVILQGRYYLQENRLIIQANIIEVRSGQVIQALRQEGSKNDLLNLLDALTQEVLGYWTVQQKKRFLQNPPKYEAYQEWLKAMPLLITDPDQAEQHLLQAYTLDSTFRAPLFSLVSLYKKEGKDSLSNEIFKYINQNASSLTRWEELRLKERKAIQTKDWLKVARYSEQRFEMDPSDQAANHNAAVAYNYANYPRKALETLEAIDQRYLSEGVGDINWRVVTEAFTNFQLGNYQQTRQLANNYAFPKMPDALAILHLKSLVHLDSTDLLFDQYEEYRARGVYNTSGQPLHPPDQLLTMICDELLLTGKTHLMTPFTTALKEMAAGPDAPGYYRIMGFVNYYEGAFDQALAFWKKQKLFEEGWPGWLRKTLAIDHASRLGVCYASIGNTEGARGQIREILTEKSANPDLLAVQQYYQARILAALGQQEEAVTALRKALELGFHPFGPVRYSNDPFLEPLIGYPPFEELIKPKG